MKWRIRRSLTALMLVFAVAATPAPAQDAPWLVGLGIGYQKSDGGCPAAAAGLTCDDKATSWKIFGGYQFNPYLGVEVGLVELGTRSAIVSGLGVATAKFRIFESLLVATLPVGERFAFYGKAGVYQWDADYEFNPPVAGSADSNGNDYTYGLGVIFNLARNFALRLEWQRYDDVGDPARTGRFNADVYGLGAFIRF